MNLTPRRNSKKATNIKVVDECRSQLFKDPLQNNCQLAIPQHINGNIDQVQARPDIRHISEAFLQLFLKITSVDNVPQRHFNFKLKFSDLMTSLYMYREDTMQVSVEGAAPQICNPDLIGSPPGMLTWYIAIIVV